MLLYYCIIVLYIVLFSTKQDLFTFIHCCCFLDQVLWIIPSEGLRWFSVVLALCLSGSVLLMTFWPAVKDDHIRISIAFMSAIVVLNVLLAVGFKVINASETFFHLW